MFEKIVLRRSEAGPALSIGELAEALLFYQNVHLVLDHGSLNGLIRALGPQKLLSILARRTVSAVYCEEMLATHTETIGATQRHQFVAFRFAGEKDRKFHSRKEALKAIVEKTGVSGREARRFAERFLESVPVRRLEDDYFVPGGVVKSAALDLLDSAYVRQVIQLALNDVTPGGSRGDFRFDVIAEHPHFYIETDIDFESLNVRRKAINSDLHPVTPAHLVSELLVSRADTLIAARYGGEFYTSELMSAIIRLRYSELLRRAGLDAAERKEFKEIVIPNAPSLREVIDSKSKSFDEFLALLDQSQRFRDWIQTVNPDEKLVQAYFNDVMAQGWLQSLPGKVIRYVLTTAIGGVWPISGAILSAADSVLLEKIAGGWRPSQFVDMKLKPFLEGASQ